MGGELRDIAGPVPIADPLALVPWALAAVLLALAVAAFVVWRRRRGSSGPDAEARARARIEAADVWRAPEHAHEYGAAVSDAVRRYVEERHGERAPRRTTEEFLRELGRRPDSPLSAHTPALAAFLELCDLAKFARRGLSDDEMRALRARALDLVTPPPEETGASTEEAA